MMRLKDFFVLLLVTLTKRVVSESIKLPSSMFGTVVDSGNTTAIVSAINKFELDTIIDVILVGNFTSISVASITSALEDANNIRPWRSLKRVYEKFIFHVYPATTILQSTVQSAMLAAESRQLSQVLSTFHSNSGAATTIFVIAAPAQQSWQRSFLQSNSVGFLNVRKSGVAWIFVPPDEIKSSGIQVQNDHSRTNLEYANAISIAAGALSPFPRSPLRPIKDVVLLHVSICSGVLRTEKCPEDSLFEDMLNLFLKMNSEDAGVTLSTSSISFNLNDYPEILHSIHSSISYSPDSASELTLNLEMLLKKLSSCKPIQQAISKAGTISRLNRDRRTYTVVPIIDVHLPDKRSIYRFPGRIPFGLYNYSTGESSQERDSIGSSSAPARAIIRVNVKDSTLDDTAALDGIRVKGNLKRKLFYLILDAAWGVVANPISESAQLYGKSVVHVTDDIAEAVDTVWDSFDIAEDFSSRRIIPRSIIISRIDRCLFSLSQLLVESSFFLNGLCAFDDLEMPQLPRSKTFPASSSSELAVGVDDLDCVSLFERFVRVLEEAAVEFTHLNFAASSIALNSAEIIVLKLKDHIATLHLKWRTRKSLLVDWKDREMDSLARRDNELDDCIDNLATDLLWRSYFPSSKALVHAVLAGIGAFCLRSLYSIVVSSNSKSHSNPNHFRQHLKRQYN
jgi:hypothetical protein